MIKPLIILTTCLFAVALSFGQTPGNDRAQPATTGQASEKREALKSLVAHYYEQLQFKPRQKEAANEIFDKYYDRYLNTIGKYEGTAAQTEQLKQLLKDASAELKPHLDKEQWSAIVNLAAQRNIKLESWEEGR
jgi:hypothetical protein